jgi:hypothetical protein
MNRCAQFLILGAAAVLAGSGCNLVLKPAVSGAVPTGTPTGEGFILTAAA